MLSVTLPLRRLLLMLLAASSAIVVSGSILPRDANQGPVIDYCNLADGSQYYKVRIDIRNCRAKPAPLYFYDAKDNLNPCIGIDAVTKDHYDLSIPVAANVTLGVQSADKKVGRTVTVSRDDKGVTRAVVAGCSDASPAQTAGKDCDLPLYRMHFKRDPHHIGAQWGHGSDKDKGDLEWQCPITPLQDEKYVGVSLSIQSSDTNMFYKHGDKDKEDHPFLVLSYCPNPADNATGLWCQAV
ncbi:uncharacterized protein PFL1_01701 [Pseudozyma flocculosa PF-1]|uniref:Uncharacterized protein n=1 Tax=Pseudozyma flocculosa TaxID=84751 RepID=A0A5C3EX92_9BASI|nr:uncharacterized protein PFL1_01701 [Pseudozyma flocculosa PF-1]EPQ30800.1 hypothetical protein PFL1_01701 [Pseudozyma flocculosa PF-1]SPO36838.1 uncharacterized protein PSFLO_02309 [Pseudozyma flocculosa]